MQSGSRSRANEMTSSLAKTTDLSLSLSLPREQGILVEIADGSGSDIAVDR